MSEKIVESQIRFYLVSAFVEELVRESEGRNAVMWIS